MQTWGLDVLVEGRIQSLPEVKIAAEGLIDVISGKGSKGGSRDDLLNEDNAEGFVEKVLLIVKGRSNLE